MTRRSSLKQEGTAEAPGEGGGKILIVDDHTLFREGVKRLLADEPGLVICGEAANACEVLSFLQQTRPDLLLLDISMPGTDGLELIKSLKSLHPGLRMMALSMHAEELYAERVLRAGAKGYLMKQASADELLLAIHTVLRGEIYLSSSLSSRLLRAIVANKGDTANEIDRLSDRELEVFRLIGRGFTTREIARSLHISAKTVESHRGNMREKLQLQTGAELTRLALSHRDGAL